MKILIGIAAFVVLAGVAYITPPNTVVRVVDRVVYQEPTCRKTFYESVGRWPREMIFQDLEYRLYRCDEIGCVYRRTDATWDTFFVEK